MIRYLLLLMFGMLFMASLLAFGHFSIVEMDLLLAMQVIPFILIGLLGVVSFYSYSS